MDILSDPSVTATNPCLITLIWVTVRGSQKEILILDFQTFLWQSNKSKSCLKFWTTDEAATDLCYPTLSWALWCAAILASSWKWHLMHCSWLLQWVSLMIILDTSDTYHSIPHSCFFSSFSYSYPLWLGERNEGPLSPPSNLGDKKRNVYAILAEETFKVHIEYKNQMRHTIISGSNESCGYENTFEFKTSGVEL